MYMYKFNMYVIHLYHGFTGSESAYKMYGAVSLKRAMFE